MSEKNNEMTFVEKLASVLTQEEELQDALLGMLDEVIEEQNKYIDKEASS